MLNVLLPISILPFVEEGLLDCRLRIPFTVILSLTVIPPDPVMERLFTFPVKIEDGRVIADEFANSIVAKALLASIFPLVLTKELPAMVKLLAPKVKVPEVKVITPFTVKL